MYHKSINIVVLDAKTFGEDLDLSPLDALGQVTVYPLSAPDEVEGRLKDADVAVINKVKMTASLLQRLPHLRMIAEMATGYDNIDVAACRARGIAVANVAGYSVASVSQLTLAMALSLYTHLPAYSQHVTSGDYTRGSAQNCLTPVYHELAGRTWGVIGFGNIGRQVGTVARAMGCRVLAYRRGAVEDFEKVSLDTLLAESDIVSLHVPLTDETRAMIDSKALSKMKRGAMLINVARGAVTDEAAVAEAVLSGQLGFFGTDVYDPEPLPKDHPMSRLIGLPQVLMTPHMAWGSYEARVRCLQETKENIRAFLFGEIRSRVDLLYGGV